MARSRRKVSQPQYIFLFILGAILIVLGSISCLISLIISLVALSSDYPSVGFIATLPMFFGSIFIGAMGCLLIAIRDIAMNTWDSANRVTRVTM
jgi:hypothetical protein